MKCFLMLVLFSASFGTSLLSQDNFNIESFLKQDFLETISSIDGNSDINEFQQQLYQLTPLGLDSFELKQEIFTTFYVNFVMQPEAPKPHTIGLVVDSLLIQRLDSEFVAFKKMAMDTEVQFRRFATKDNWEKSVKPILLKLQTNIHSLIKKSMNLMISIIF